MKSILICGVSHSGATTLKEILDSYPTSLNIRIVPRINPLEWNNVDFVICIYRDFRDSFSDMLRDSDQYEYESAREVYIVQNSRLLKVKSFAFSSNIITMKFEEVFDRFDDILNFCGLSKDIVNKDDLKTTSKWKKGLDKKIIDKIHKDDELMDLIKKLGY